MRTPKVSVCIDVFNYEAFLPTCIASVLDQTFPDIEVVVVDDCSTDGSFAVARDFAATDSRIVTLRNETNLGMVGNRNACLRAARGEYIKILHADDFLSSSDTLSKMVIALDRNPGVSLVSGALQIVTSSGAPQGRLSLFEETHPLIGTSVITRCLRERKNLVGPPSATMFRRTRGLRGFDEHFFNSADWEMWFHLLEQGSYLHLPEALVSYRRHSCQQTEKDKLSLSEAEDALGLLARYLDRPYIALSPLCKRHLRERAQADLVRRKCLLGMAVSDSHKGFAPLAFLYGQYLRHVRRVERRKTKHIPLVQKQPVGLNVAGFLSGEYGIGDSSRAFAHLIKDSGLPSVFLKIPSRNHRNEDRSFPHDSRRNPYSVNLMTFSFDYARRFARDMGRRFFKDRVNIGIWFWELETFPAKWHARFEGYDEIWVCTSFCQRALAAVSPVPVVSIGYPMPAGHEPPADREAFNLPKEACLFLFSFDFHSVVERKNPEVVVDAFVKAFGKNNPHACLILKSINAHHHPDHAAKLRQLAGASNIVWMSEHLDGHKMRQLFATADCYVSLHRVEGLGLGMVQSMDFAKPVIATAYSGNMDFTTPTNSLLVDYTLTEIERDHGVYERGNFWANANTDHAAERMRWVFDHRSEASELGKIAQHDIRKLFAPKGVLQKIRTRLGERDERFKSL